MKRLFAIVCALLCGIISAFALAACADPGAPEHATDGSGLSISVESVADKIKEFADIEDRTTYTQGEKNAADYLHGKLIDYGYSDAEITDFSLNDNNYQVKSQNVKAVYRSSAAGENAKNVIIGAYYDNRYGSTAGYTGVGATGAIGNCTGVAATLAVAEYLQTQKPELDYTVSIVFFGAGAVATYGAQYYYRNMSQTERANTVLMVELQRLGFDHVYAFSDERKTRREAFFDGVAAENKLDIYKPTQKSPIMSGMYALEGVPYYRWAHTGIFAPFFNSGIPTLNLIGGDWETIDITDNDRITVTAADTYQNMVRDYPRYAENTAAAASFTVKALESDGFLAAMQYDRDNFPDTAVLNKDWIWYLVVLCTVLVGVLVMNLISSHLAKKYPIVAPQPKTVKMAVFGMDYEDKNTADIFVDVKRVSPTEDIFPGIPNNDAPASRTDDPFDPFGLGAPLPTASSQSDPFDNVPAPVGEKREEQGGVADAEQKAAESAVSDNNDNNGNDGATDKTESAETAKDAPIDAPDNSDGARSTPAEKPKTKSVGERAAANKPKSASGAKRKTVSAGKSVHGGKSESDEKNDQAGETDEK